MSVVAESTDSLAWCERFLRHIEVRSTSTVLPFTWVAGGIFHGRYAVVIYREEGHQSALSGRIYDAAAQTRAFQGSSPEQIADAAVAGDLTDPSGPGEPWSWEWAQQLAGTAEPIGWHGLIPRTDEAEGPTPMGGAGA